MGRRLTGLGIAIDGAQGANPGGGVPPRYLNPDRTGNGPAEILVLVAERSGRVIGELDAEIAGVSWKLGDYGQARLTIPRSGGTATETLLRPGNRMLIQFGNGLPDWGGVVDLPRRWRDGRIEVVAYGGERLLADRVTGRGRYFSNVTAGQIFTALIREATPMGVEIGEVWMGGALHSPDYHYRSLYDIFTKSLSGRIEQADWGVEAYLRGGVIVFRANYYERRGVDRGRKVALIGGVNLANESLQEQGTIKNEWFLAGAGSGWGADNRIYATARDAVSVARYGLRQGGEVRVDVSARETLDKSAAVALEESREPRRVVDLTALDLPPGRWGQYGIGDRIWTELYDVGFGGYGESVRIRAREFLPGRGVCSLVVE